jgi:hypothetical protein
MKIVPAGFGQVAIQEKSARLYAGRRHPSAGSKVAEEGAVLPKESFREDCHGNRRKKTGPNSQITSPIIFL